MAPQRVKDTLSSITQKLAHVFGFRGQKIASHMSVDEWLTSKSWVNVKGSTLLAAIKYELEGPDEEGTEEGTLFVRFRRDGFLATYPNVSKSWARSMYISSSPGKTLRHSSHWGSYLGGHRPG